MMELSPEKKIAGILAPLFGLRSDNDLGIGDVAVLREFIDWAAEIGFKLVQLLPINEMGHDNSPYNAISAMAIEPTTLHLAPGSPEDLTREDYEAALADVDLAKLRHGPDAGTAPRGGAGISSQRTHRQSDNRRFAISANPRRGGSMITHSSAH